MVEWNNGTTTAKYAYIHNLQGDIVALIDSTGAKVVSYTYDAWGKPLSTTGTLANTLGKLNPFRYRGYIYDEETGLYYLRSRYYSATLHRFINADCVYSNNIFIYTNNRPITQADYGGYSSIDITVPSSAIFQKAINEQPGESLSRTTEVSGGSVLALAYGLLIAPFAALLSLVFDTSNTTAVTKSETNSISTSSSAQTPTVIYRYGGTNPGNLTPKEKDKNTGLSFSTVPRPNAAATTIEALNATGIVYAVRDGATHVSVRPVGAEITDWINAGPCSIWTQAVQSVVVKWKGE
ncbi:MAG: RHS repeat-associated core domain-containing protein [Clostridiales bacterium]|nr:RHS repeat-associated core domain-containing protein [Clostridiales bacterium]